MPALPVANKVIRIDYGWIIGEDTTAKNREFFQYSGTAPTNTDLVNFLDAIAAQFGSGFKSMFAIDRQLLNMAATDLTSSTAATAEVAVGITGTRAGGTPPADIAMLTSLEIHRRYRGGHARVYWPAGVNSDFLDAQNWNTAFVSAFSSAYLSHVSAVEGAGWTGAGAITPVNVSFYEGFTVHTGVTGRARNVSTPRATSLIDLVISYVIRQGVASIRNRLLHLA